MGRNDIRHLGEPGTANPIQDLPLMGYRGEDPIEGRDSIGGSEKEPIS